MVTLNCQLPTTLLTASAGRTLGDLVATGIPELDARSVMAAELVDDRATFVLRPDVITVGEAMRQPAVP